MRFLFLFVFLVGGCSVPSSDSDDNKPLADLVVTGGRIVDVESGEIIDGRAIVINADRIHSIVPVADAPESSKTFDAGGRFIIPGLWDMHAHALYDQWPVVGEGTPYTWGAYMDLMLAHGITGFRDMWSTPGAITQARAELASGERVGPQFIAAGHGIGWFKYIQGLTKVTTEEETRALVRQAKADGADFIKLGVYNPAYLLPWFADEAQKQGIDIAGHVPPDMGALEAANYGLRSLEHSFGVIPGCASGGEEAIELARTDFEETGEISFPFILQSHPLLTDLDEESCTSLAKSLAEYEVWVSPTVALWEAKVTAPTLDIETDPRFELAADIDREIWLGSIGYWRRNAEESGDRTARQYDLRLRLIKTMHDNGVPIIAGSDFMNLAATPGMGLLDEIRNYEKAGLSPLDALRTATLEPARYMRRTGELGTVTAGKIADLVVLDKNPLESIENASTTHAVVARGVLLDREALDGLLQGAKGVLRGGEPTPESQPPANENR